MTNNKKYTIVVSALLVLLLLGGSVSLVLPTKDSCDLVVERYGTSLAEVSELAKKAIETVGRPPCTVTFTAFPGRDPETWFSWKVELTFPAFDDGPTVTVSGYGLGSLD